MKDTNKSISLSEAIRIAVAHHQAGNLDQAGAIYRKILQEVPDHPDALNLLGMVYSREGKHEAAIDSISRAIQLNPCTQYYNNLGEAFRYATRYNEAIESYNKALSINPDNVDALNNLGLVFNVLGENDAAIESYSKAIAFRPDYAQTYFNLGYVYQGEGEPGKAIESYRNAVHFKPDYAEAYNNLGIVLLRYGNENDARSALEKALSINPDNSQAHYNLGLVYQTQGCFRQALDCYQKALSLQPDYPDVYNNIGLVQHAQGHFDKALSCYQKAILLQPEHAASHTNLGALLRDTGDHARALECYQTALSLQPDLAEAHWGYTMAQIPALPDAEDDIVKHRANFLARLEILEGWFGEDKGMLGCQSVGTLQPFYLAYHAENNHELLARYGGLCARLMKQWWNEQGIALPERETSRAIRVGVVSAHIHNHSVWNALVKGWFRHLDQERIELHVFHLSLQEDDETAWAISRATSFTQGGKGLRSWVDEILGKQLDVTVYPEIGMDPMTLKLAGLRLAPVQAATWGHPETTGLPTIDYYLSAEAMEPDDAEDNYTERLVKLPNLGCCYRQLPVEIIEPDFSALGIETGLPVLLCPGTPFKYMPGHDWIYPEIAKRTGHCQFVFFTQTGRFADLSDKLARRLESCFTKAGLSYNEYVVFIPWQGRCEYYGLMSRSDVMLDTMGFSGFNTAIQALECGLPYVAMEGRFMRGRLASGILRRGGIPELVASDEEGFIALVDRLLKDAEFRKLTREKINESYALLFDDLEPVIALENFLVSVVKNKFPGAD